jgi:hypothetical protein
MNENGIWRKLIAPRPFQHIKDLNKIFNKLSGMNGACFIPWKHYGRGFAVCNNRIRLAPIMDFWSGLQIGTQMRRLPQQSVCVHRKQHYRTYKMYKGPFCNRSLLSKQRAAYCWCSLSLVEANIVLVLYLYLLYCTCIYWMYFVLYVYGCFCKVHDFVRCGCFCKEWMIL